MCVRGRLLGWAWGHGGRGRGGERGGEYRLGSVLVRRGEGGWKGGGGTESEKFEDEVKALEKGEAAET